MTWNSHCFQLLDWSRRFLTNQNQDDFDIKQKWKKVILDSQAIWEKLTVGESVIFEFENKEDWEEEEILSLEELADHIRFQSDDIE